MLALAIWSSPLRAMVLALLVLKASLFDVVTQNIQVQLRVKVLQLA